MQKNDDFPIEFAIFTKALPTDLRTDGPTDRRTDRPSYRDARTHLKTARGKRQKTGKIVETRKKRKEKLRS